MKLLAGRNVEQSDTTREYVMNEAYARFLGFTHPADIVGKSVEHGSGKIPIVGLVADVHTRSLRETIHPVAFTSSAQYHNTFHIALPPTNANKEWKNTIARIEKAWKEVYPEEDFNYTFF